MSLAPATPARPSSGNLTRQSPQHRSLGTRNPHPGRGPQPVASVASGCSPKTRHSSLLKEVLCLEGALLDKHNSSSSPDRPRYSGSPRSSSSNRQQHLSLGNLPNSSRLEHLCLQTLQQQIPLGSRLVAHLEALSRNSLLVFLGTRSPNNQLVFLGARSPNNRLVYLEMCSRNSRLVSLEPYKHSSQIICSETPSHSSQVDCLGARLLSRHLLLAGWE